MSTRRFVAISEPPCCGLQCLGVFDDHRTAVGEVMDSMLDVRADYLNEGDVFEHDEFDEMEGEGGLIMEVRYRAARDVVMLKHYYYILYVDD